MTTPTMTPATGTTFGPLDRCDRCGARALARAVLPCGGELLFCGHHGRRFRAALLDLGATVHPAG